MIMDNLSLVVFCDGACGPTNPNGNVGVGVIFYECEELVIKNKDTSGIMTQKKSTKKLAEISRKWKFGEHGLTQTSNNLAEHMAISEALVKILDDYSHYDKVYLFSDSDLAINQMNGKYRISGDKIYSEQALRNYTIVLDMLEAGFDIEFIWIPRTLNTAADELSKFHF